MQSKINNSEKLPTPTRDKSLSWCKTSADRFIPNRRHANSTTFDMLPIKDLLSPLEEEPSEDQFNALLRASFSNLDSTRSSNLFTYNNTKRKTSEKEPVKKRPVRRSKFQLPKQPSHVLEAIDIEDDFYLNVIDWSSSNKVAIVLNNTIYSVDVESGERQKIYTAFECEASTALKWDRSGQKLAVGNALGQVTIWDLEKQKETVVLEENSDRIGSIDWGSSLLVGGGDGVIRRVDPRQRYPACSFNAHEDQVCQLRWAPDESLFASGGNDRRLFLWSPKHQTPLMKEDHGAPVKALDWSVKRHGILASGGGSADKTIRMWNTVNKELLYKRETTSQVCSLVFSKRSGDVISGHGEGELFIWRAKGLKKVGELTGHEERVLYTGLSPCGEIVLSVSADERMMFWQLFGEEKEKTEKIEKKSFISSSSLLR